jgi:hypothetical protein
MLGLRRAIVMLFDASTAKTSRRRFGGSNYHVWTDAHGNVQLCCYSTHEKGYVLVTAAAIDAFKGLPCEAAKSVRFANPVSRMDIVVEIDELSKLEALESSFGKPYYLIGADTFSSEEDGYPPTCTVS